LAGGAKEANVDVHHPAFYMTIVITCIWAFSYISLTVWIFLNHQIDNEFYLHFGGIHNIFPFLEELVTKLMMLGNVALFGGVLSPHKLPPAFPTWVFSVVTAGTMIYPRLVESYYVYRTKKDLDSYAREFELLADRPPFDDDSSPNETHQTTQDVSSAPNTLVHSDNQTSDKAASHRSNRSKRETGSNRSNRNSEADGNAPDLEETEVEHEKTFEELVQIVGHLFPSDHLRDSYLTSCRLNVRIYAALRKLDEEEFSQRADSKDLFTTTATHMSSPRKLWCMAVEVALAHQFIQNEKRDDPASIVSTKVKRISTEEVWFPPPYLDLVKKPDEWTWKEYIAAESRANDDSIVALVFHRTCLPLFIFDDNQLAYLLKTHQGLSAKNSYLPKGLVNGILQLSGLDMYKCTPSIAFAMRGISTSYSIRKSSFINSLKRWLDVLFYSAVALAQFSYVPSEETPAPPTPMPSIAAGNVSVSAMV